MKEISKSKKIKAIQFLIEMQEAAIIGEHVTPFMCHNMKEYLNFKNGISTPDVDLYNAFPEFEKFILDGGKELSSNYGETYFDSAWFYESDVTMTKAEFCEYKITKLKQFLTQLENLTKITFEQAKDEIAKSFSAHCTFIEDDEDFIPYSEYCSEAYSSYANKMEASEYERLKKWAI